MALFGRKKREKPRSQEEMFQGAIGDLAVDLDKKDKRRKKRQRKLLLPAWLDRRILIGLAVILVIIIADAVRRENQEFIATLTGYSGQVTVQETGGAFPTPPVQNQQLVDDMVVNTGQGSYATIEFPDGSVTTLDQNTQFVVKLMEYSRGGRWRARSFMLVAGRVWSNVGPNFGEKSEMKVYTPTSVAAVRGTQYAVSYDSKKQLTTIQCNDGYVTAEGFTGQDLWVGQGGETSVEYGQAPAQPEWMKAEAKQTFAQDILNRPIPPELWIKTAELTLTQLLDAPLSILGIGKCSWAVGSADFARRTAAMEQLRRLAQFMEGYPRYPHFVNPATLEPLTIPREDAKRMLKAFHGSALLKYQPMQGLRSYRMTVQARDKRRTTFVLTPTGIQQVEQ